MQNTAHPRRRQPASWRPLAALALAIAAACSDKPTTISPAAGSPSALEARQPAAPNVIQLGITGLPAGTLANVRVTGPGGYNQVVNGSTTLGNLADGNYTVTATRIVVGGAAYDPSPASQSVNLRKGKTVSLAVAFSSAPTTGSLTVTITIPEVTPAPVTVTGPGGFSQSVPATQTLSSLTPGTYTIAATNFTAPSGVSYVTSALSQTANVVAGGTPSASVTYTANSVPPGGYNLQILGAYITQSTQTLASGVPLVSGRDGVLRVFAAANTASSALPAVRARLYVNGTLIATYTIPAPSGGAPTALNEGSMTTSWNVKIPGAQMQPGLSILADVDPAAAIAESNETDNNFPASGTPLAQNVRVVPVLNTTLVPVVSSGLQGNVTTSNAAAFLQPLQDMFPLQSVTSVVRAPYTTTATLLSDGTGWSPVLSEVRALRTADGSPTHYYGVVKVTYGSGVAGMGYIGLPSSIGWDYMPSGGQVLAHEFGHNFGRSHAPCGGPANPDPGFPYTGGIIGAWGFNVRTNALIPRTNPDLMTYCGPEWISDYTYKAVFNYRGSSATSAATTAAVSGLLVWGRVGNDGTIILEPAVQINAPVSLPQGGAYLLEATDASGATLFSYTFDPEATSDHAGPPERHFAFVIPLSNATAARLQGVSVSGRGRSSDRRSQLGATQLQGVADAASASATAPGRTRVQWNGGAQGASMAVVRDAQSGQILSFARGGSVEVATGGAEVDVLITDGVRTHARRIRVSGR